MVETADREPGSGQAAHGVEERSIAEIQAELASGALNSVDLARAYVERIRAIDADGPSLCSVIAINPRWPVDATAADAARSKNECADPLAGVPVLIKDNIDCAGMATTAGSLALENNEASRDAPLVARLRGAGAVILGKTNLSEWANFRSRGAVPGWSAIGGVSKNPYALDRSAGGSSSGTAAAVAASLCAVGVGTETDGSIVIPASMNGLVGLKPTVGLVSRTSVVPISRSQDTPGPMARSVADAAALLCVLAGGDADDPATRDAERCRTDYVAALSGATLKNVRLGVLRYASRLHPRVDALFEATLERLRDHGAAVVEIADYRPDGAMLEASDLVLLTEFKFWLNAYLAATPPSVKVRSLKDVIAFNCATARESSLFGQDILVAAQQTEGLSDRAYLDARSAAKRLATEEGIDALIGANRLTALVAPTWPPTRHLDALGGRIGATTVSSLPAIAGYPHLTVPMGQIMGLPVGFSFVGPAWSEARLLALGSAFEAAVCGRQPPTYTPSIESLPDNLRHLAPFRSR